MLFTQHYQISHHKHYFQNVLYHSFFLLATIIAYNEIQHHIMYFAVSVINCVNFRSSKKFVY